MSIIQVVLLGSVLGAGLLSSAMASEITFVNTSPAHTPIALDYVIAHVNPGEAVVYGEKQHIVLEKSQEIRFELAGYSMAGVVPLRMNGHDLPEDARAFPPEGDTCSFAATNDHTTGKLFLKMVGSNEHGSITCSKTRELK